MFCKKFKPRYSVHASPYADIKTIKELTQNHLFFFAIIKEIIKAIKSPTVLPTFDQKIKLTKSKAVNPCLSNSKNNLFLPTCLYISIILVSCKEKSV